MIIVMSMTIQNYDHSRLCDIITLSITTNVFPEKWKIAQVTPLHKGDVRNDINNYRPISILPTLSKILKKHVVNSLLKFLRDDNLIYCGADKGGGKGGSAPPPPNELNDHPCEKMKSEEKLRGGTMTMCSRQK